MIKKKVTKWTLLVSHAHVASRRVVDLPGFLPLIVLGVNIKGKQKKKCGKLIAVFTLEFGYGFW